MIIHLYCDISLTSAVFKKYLIGIGYGIFYSVSIGSSLLDTKMCVHFDQGIP